MSAGAAKAAESFMPHRAALIGLAYRMTGSRVTAEDIAQEVFLRWQGAARAEVTMPRAWLMKATARLALDHLKSAARRREDYVGPWLPEPVLDNLGAPQEVEHTRAQSVSLAFLLTLERLSPAERAVFILHDLFDTPFGEIGALLHKSEAACRQMALRARAHVSDAKPRQTVTDAESAQLTQAFLAATQTGDEAELRALLAEDAVVHTDGGGIRPAAFNLILGGTKAARMFARLATKKSVTPPVIYRGLINGSPGFVTMEPDGLPQATVLDLVEHRITAVYVIRNPEKLQAIAGALGLSLNG
jgi:RNA polymerase sigma-70 factor, ECF subfamily